MSNSEEYYRQLDRESGRQMDLRQHASDCPVNNGPALPAGPCDCAGLSEQQKAWRAYDHEHRSDEEVLRAENRELREKVAFFESREVCTKAHDDVDMCGYCQRDFVIGLLREVYDPEHFRSFEVDRLLQVS